MNNLDRAIAVLKTIPVTHFNMTEWRAEKPAEYNLQMEPCGTVVCFLGALADSPDIPEITWGDGQPMIKVGPVAHYGSKALACFLQIGHSTAQGLCGVGAEFYYGKAIGKVTPQDVINELEEMK